MAACATRSVCFLDIAVLLGHWLRVRGLWALAQTEISTISVHYALVNALAVIFNPVNMLKDILLAFSVLTHRLLFGRSFNVCVGVLEVFCRRGAPLWASWILFGAIAGRRDRELHWLFEGHFDR